MHFGNPFSFSFSAILACAACGGEKPPPSDATSQQMPAAPAATPSAAPAPSASAAPAAAEPAPTAQAAAPDAPEPVTPIADRLIAGSVAFMIRFDDSAPKQAADAACAKVADDPEAKVKCMEKERGRFVADVLRFHKDDKGLYFTIYRRQGNSLQELCKSAVDFADETPNRVAVKIKSDKGTRPLFAGKKELSVSTPPDSTSNIEIDDPRLGKLIYEARIGLVNE